MVIGAGGHAAEVCSYVAEVAHAGEPVRLLGCLDDNLPAGRSRGLDVLGDLAILDDLLRSTGNRLRAITAVGDNPTRRQLVERVDRAAGGRLRWWTLRHPAARVGSDAVVADGVLLAPGSIVTARVRVGSHVIVNVNASVSHDSALGDYVNVNPGAVIAGNARLGEGCYVGAGATVIDRITVGEWSIVGAGAAVVRDVPAHVTVVGVPARIIKAHAAAAAP